MKVLSEDENTATIKLKAVESDCCDGCFVSNKYGEESDSKVCRMLKCFERKDGKRISWVVEE